MMSLPVEIRTSGKRTFSPMRKKIEKERRKDIWRKGIVSRITRTAARCQQKRYCWMHACCLHCIYRCLYS